MCFLLFFLLFAACYAQQNSCDQLHFNGVDPQNGIFFGDFIGKGGSNGRLSIRGDATLEQFSSGIKLPNNAQYTMLVNGRLKLLCGDLHGNVYYGSSIEIGPRVDWYGYSSSQVSDVYPFSQVEDYFTQIHQFINEMAQEPSSAFGNVQRQNTLLRFVGGGRDFNFFTTTCDDIAGAQGLRFAGIPSTDTATIIINVVGDGCSINIAGHDISGLGFSDPASHILWNFQTNQAIDLNGVVFGSILAPQAEFTGEGQISGQVIARSANGTFFVGSNLFQGCIPSDICLLSDCPAVVKPEPCFGAEVIQDPNNQCCELYRCHDSCDTVSCVIPEASLCTWPYSLTKVADPTEEGGGTVSSTVIAKPCCPTYACMPHPDFLDQLNAEDFPDPFVTDCPSDIDAVIQLPSTSVRVSWEPPRFLYTQGFSSNYNPGDQFNAGDYVVMYEATGLKPGSEPIYCMFKLAVITNTISSTCTVGGVTYAEGDTVTTECNAQCTCTGGELVGCIRIRPELLGMNFEFRAQYWQAFITAYNDGDDVLVDLINEHVLFFSRGLHNNGAFLPWHRYYLLAAEQRIRQADCRFDIPYWGWHDVPRVNTNNIWGLQEHQVSGNGGAGRCVIEGTFGSNNGFLLTNGRCLQRRITGGAAASAARIETDLMRRYTEPSQYDSFRNRLEHGPGLHDSIHCIVGGTMCSARSSNDPVFFSHHANIDYIWSRWQSRSNAFMTAYTGGRPRDQLMVVSTVTAGEMLNTLDLGGGYEPYIYLDESLINTLLENFAPADFQNIGHSAVGPVGDQWLNEMNMDDADVEVIREAERLYNSQAIVESVAMALANGAERSLEMPGLVDTVNAVAQRMALAGQRSEDEIDVRLLFDALARALRRNNVVPRFYELRDIIINDEDGELVDIVTVPEPIVCSTNWVPVCFEGQTFPNECEAVQAGYTNFNDGECAPPPPPPSIPEDIDGGDADAYNHEIQELEECPPTRPSPGPCPIIGVTCFYGVECCEVYRSTVSCTAQGWSFVNMPWSSCDEVNCDNPTVVEVPDNNVRPIATRPPTVAPTRRPTRAPTRRPTRAPTDSPTRAPTRSNVISPRPPIPQPPVRPTSPPVSQPPVRPRPVIVPQVPSRTRPNRFVQVQAINTPRPPPPPPLVLPPPVCPVVRCPPFAPTCCSAGHELRRSPIRNNRGVICDQGCMTCMFRNRPMPVPVCCATPIACAMVVCEPPQVAVLVRTRGSDNAAPCCDEYRCGSPCENVVCPGSPVCRFEFETVVSTGLTLNGCCEGYACVFDRCGEDTFTCPGGEVLSRDPTSQPIPCSFPQCPPVCQDRERRLFCTGEGGVLTEREREPAPSCAWVDCPPYDPCTDETLRLPDGSFCGAFGTCLPGRSTLECECEDNYSGPRCQTFTQPPRPTVDMLDRVFLLTDTCVGYMCESSACSMTTDHGQTWTPLDASIVSIKGYWGDNLWAVDSNQYAARLLLNEVNSPISSSTTLDALYQTQSSMEGFVSANFEVSYRTASPGEFPPPSESAYILNYEVDLVNAEGQCAVHVYLNHAFVIFYNKDVMFMTSWGEACAENAMCTSGEVTTEDMCPDLCLLANGEKKECQNDGYCRRETGECICQYGFSGELCEIES